MVSSRPLRSSGPDPTRFAGLKVAVADSPNPLKWRRSGRQGHFVPYLKELGCDAIHVHDGEAEGLNVDLLILYGNSRSFYKYASLLRDSARRPRVAIWQIDPLPPPELDRELEAAALRLSDSFSHSRLSRPVEMVVTQPTFRVISERGLGIYSDQSKGYFVDTAMARTVVEAYAFIRRGLQEKWIDDVFVTTMGKQRFLAGRGIDSVFAPVGFYPKVGEDRDQPRDIDVLFIGKLKKDYRRKRLALTLRALEQSGARVLVVERGCYGETRTALLNRTKIVLNILKYPWDTPWMRWALSSACGAAVVSETLSDSEPLIPGEHYVEAPFDDLPKTIEQFLEDPGGVLAMARHCAHLFRTDMSLRGSLEKVLDSALTPSLVA